MANLIAYNTTDLDALLITEKAEIWFNRGWLSTELLAKIKAHYKTNFYSPNIFMRIGGFVFSIILMIKTAVSVFLHPVTDEGLVTLENLSNVAHKNGHFDHRLDEG